MSDHNEDVSARLVAMFGDPVDGTFVGCDDVAPVSAPDPLGDIAAAVGQPLTDGVLDIVERERRLSLFRQETAAYRRLLAEGADAMRVTCSPLPTDELERLVDKLIAEIARRDAEGE